MKNEKETEKELPPHVRAIASVVLEREIRTQEDINRATAHLPTVISWMTPEEK